MGKIMTSGLGAGDLLDAALLLDGDDAVRGWTAAAVRLLGADPAGLPGRPVGELLVDAGGADGIAPGADTCPSARPAAGGPLLRCRRLRLAPAGSVLLLAARERVRREEEDAALVQALFAQTRVGLAVHDAALRVTRVNAAGRAAGPPGLEPPGGGTGVRLDTVLVDEDAAAIHRLLERVLRDGEPAMDIPCRVRVRGRPLEDRLASVSALPLVHDGGGEPSGVVSAFVDVTEEHRSRQAAELVHAAALEVGTVLDPVRCARDAARVLVPRFADLAAVDLTETVLSGGEPEDFRQGVPLRRVAAVAAEGAWPAELYPPGHTFQVRGAAAEHLRRQAPALLDLAGERAVLAADPHCRKLLLPGRGTSCLAAVLQARGQVLGSVLLWRTGDRAPFDERDVQVAEEIVSRTALGIDNARHYVRERGTARALRSGLLPPPEVRLSAGEVASFHVSAASVAGAGGTWCDVVPLSSARVAFVVGDTTGHGLPATATTGRIRTAVQTLSELDLAPEELLTHLQGLVGRLAYGGPGALQVPPEAATGDPAPPGERGGAPVLPGATCLYAVYDPVSCRCALASAGHPPPLVLGPDGEPKATVCPVGPALAVDADPIEPVEQALEPGSLLAFHSARVTAAAGRQALAEALRSAARRHSSPADIGREALARLFPVPPDADAVLLLARVRALPAGRTAGWQFPADPEAVGQAREAVATQLTSWGLGELAFTTELIASELVTNAVRYAGGPIGLRLVRDHALICEVSDPSQTHPHLRRARLTDEGGRGLFLVHQLTQRWGSRYTPAGKTIWTAQHLPDGARAAPSTDPPP